MTYQTIRNIAQELIKNLGTVTPDGIREQVAVAMRLVPPGSSIDADALVRDLEARFNVWIGGASILDSNDVEEHVPWLPARRGDIQWDFWGRYRDYLVSTKGFEPAVTDRLYELTDSVLERLEDPRRPGPWDRRGMVVGHVQSGKTANYTGLICKAIDAGYRLVIILTGMHNDLRSQTQLRIDEGVLGIDTRRTLAFSADARNHLIGVGRHPWPRRLVANTLTSSLESGDFRRAVADNAGVIPGNDPLVLVVKKNGSVLDNLYAWAVAVVGNRDQASGRMLVRDVPLLLIDDEADLASVNTKKVPVDDEGNLLPDEDPTRINGAIRKLLHLFDRKAYVAYTATPFANVFIHPDYGTTLHGPDLFPRNFIVSLPAPSNYVGPAQVFGLEAAPDAAIERSAGVDIIRDANDQDTWLPVDHKKEFVPQVLPVSLIKAIHSFILACAARTARGQGQQHKSMLVHVTRFTRVQGIIRDMVRTEVGNIRRRLEFGEGAAPTLVPQLKELWERDFVATSNSLPEYVQTPIRWEQVEPLLLRETMKIEVRAINGTAQDALAYAENERDGLSVIAIGGDKLSRGLTLEGLSTSYYLRASRMYDTLMQMGRWFGYRPGYLDLCRLYTSDELVYWYRHITLANEELRQEFDMMAAAYQSPEEFGLRIRTHPSGLLVTAANKLRNGTVLRLGYDGDLSETIIFDRNETVLRSNLRALELLVGDMGGVSSTTSKPNDRVRFRWDRVPGTRIAEFLDSFKTHERNRKVRTELLALYIRAQLDQPEPELTEWTVAILSKGSEGAERYTVADCDVSLTSRARYPATVPPHPRFLRIRQLHSPRDEAIDLDKGEEDKARQRSRQLPPTRRSSGGTGEGAGPANELRPLAIREARPKQRGLLLFYLLQHPDSDPALPPVGIVLSFPKSSTATTIEYVVNNTYWEQEFGS